CPVSVTGSGTTIVSVQTKAATSAALLGSPFHSSWRSLGLVFAGVVFVDVPPPLSFSRCILRVCRHSRSRNEWVRRREQRRRWGRKPGYSEGKLHGYRDCHHSRQSRFPYGKLFAGSTVVLNIMTS